MPVSNELSLKQAILAYINASEKLKSKLYLTKVKIHWETAMGTPIMKYTTDIHLRKKKLYVHIDSAPLRQELAMNAEKILTILNESLGENYLEEVIIR